MTQRSKINQRSYCQKSHPLDMTFIPAKYEIDGLYGQGTAGQKRMLDIQMYVWTHVHTDRQTAPAQYIMSHAPLAGDIIIIMIINYH